MLRSLVRWSVRVAVTAGVGLTVARIVANRRSGGGVATSGLFPPIGGDTWPPVPVADKR